MGRGFDLVRITAHILVDEPDVLFQLTFTHKGTGGLATRLYLQVVLNTKYVRYRVGPDTNQVFVALVVNDTLQLHMSVIDNNVNGR